MISWLWAFLAFVIGEFIGLATCMLFTSEKNVDKKKGGTKNVQISKTK